MVRFVQDYSLTLYATHQYIVWHYIKYVAGIKQFRCGCSMVHDAAGAELPSYSPVVLLRYCKVESNASRKADH